jgi:predicted membrane-bound spermidine synthase
MLAALLSRRTEAIPRLYGANLLGAGLACAAAVALLAWIGPPASVLLAGGLLALIGARLAGKAAPGLCAACATVAVLLAAVALWPRALPDPLPDRFSKQLQRGSALEFSRWGPLFRVDVSALPDAQAPARVVLRDAAWSSALQRFAGDLSELEAFERDALSFAFRVLGSPPRRVAVLGSGGSREILSALYFGARQVTAVELSPLMLSLLRDVFADFTGHLHRHPRVELRVGEARSALARDPHHYDVIQLLVPRAHAAMNAASSAAFLPQESYLLTAGMVRESLEHLSERGILCAQFGELVYEEELLRTARFLTTAREAYRRLGKPDFGSHAMVATSPAFGRLATVLLKKTPFTPAERARFLDQLRVVPGGAAGYAAGWSFDEGALGQVLSRGDRPLERWLTSQPYLLGPVLDDAPFFWHFRRFRDVLEELATPSQAGDPDVMLDERLLLSWLLLSAALAAGLLLLPFLIGRKSRLPLPCQAHAAACFAALGLGFVIYEICLIQKLTLFLGHPTRSLSLTLSALLVCSGLGSLASQRCAPRRGATTLLAVLVVWTVLAHTVAGPAMERLDQLPLAARALLAALFVVPLGLALGGFVPLGLRAFARLAPQRPEAVAWAWAVVGLAAGVGSALATVFSMSLGFRALLLGGLASYALAAAALRALAARELA